jgi:hypothetical protein
MYTVSLLTSKDVKSKVKALCGQFDVMVSFYQPLAHPVHHFAGEWSSCAQHEILTYGTAKDQMPKEAIMDRTMTVLGLCFGNLKEGDRSAYNVAMHEFMVDYNSRDDPRVTPKVQHQEAWQSPEALL